MMTTLSKNDYRVLVILMEYGCTTDIKAISIKKIQEFTGLSINKIRITLKYFKSTGLINEGAVEHNAKTYFISNNGKEKIHELLN